MQNDLVVSCIRGSWCSIDHIRYYAKSLSVSGFAGRKMMFVDQMPEETRNFLKGFGFELVDFTVEGINDTNFLAQGRFVAMLDFLKDHYQDFRYIVWTDVGDVVFQTDPSVWLDLHLGSSRIAAATECWRIRDEGFNNSCLRDAMSDADYEYIRHHEALCCGTLAGTSELIYKVFLDVYTYVRDTMVRKGRFNNYSPIDQAVLNYFLRQSPYKEVTSIPRMAEGFTATCSVFRGNGFHSHINFDRNNQTDDTPIFDKNSGTIFTPDGKTPFSIVHQYNRDGGWKAIIEKKYQ